LLVPTQRVCDTATPANDGPSVNVRGQFYLRSGSDLREPTRASVDPHTGLIARDGEPFWAADEYREAFRTARLEQFDAMMQADQGHCMRALRIRENWQLQLTVCGRRRTLFLKKHHVRCWGSRLRAWLGLPARRSAGRDEAMNIRRLQSAAIPCMELAAYGERLGADGLLESFLLTPELEGFVQLDDFLRTRFGCLNAERSERRDADLTRLTDRIAAITRQFHEAGFNHRDLYCCHFFIWERSRGDFEIRLIDLQRVQYRKRRRRRWLVKDLAQLAYSAPRDRIKCTQKMAFIRRYFGVTRLRPEHKRFIREVLAKQQAMEGRLGRIA
jgi:heptose I phosphotransferase